MFRWPVPVLVDVQGEENVKSKKAIEAKIVKDVTPFEEIKLEKLGAGLPVTREDLNSIRGRISLLKEFVSDQMRVNTDYGVIPGTHFPSLYQPGAQKLARLFGLTIKKECTERVLDREKNFAMFTYQASVYHAGSGQLLAQCEGSCNSQERKYARRKDGETPVCDVLNTLMKMAQKRAMVGAVIEACGASDFFTQDIDSPEDAEAIGISVPTPRTPVNIPKVNSHTSEQLRPQPSADCPQCKKKMMISKYNEAEWYCSACQLKVPRA